LVIRQSSGEAHRISLEQFRTVQGDDSFHAVGVDRLVVSQKTIIIPAENAKDVSQIPDGVLSKVEIIPVRTIEEALDRVLDKPANPDN
jgi:hypothetical protein